MKAYCDAGAMVMSYHQDDTICPYTNCAVELCKKLGWYGVRLVGGIVKSGEYVFTIDDDDCRVESDRCPRTSIGIVIDH